MHIIHIQIHVFLYDFHTFSRNQGCCHPPLPRLVFLNRDPQEGNYLLLPGIIKENDKIYKTWSLRVEGRKGCPTLQQKTCWEPTESVSKVFLYCWYSISHFHDSRFLKCFWKILQKNWVGWVTFDPWKAHLKKTQTVECEMSRDRQLPGIGYYHPPDARCHHTRHGSMPFGWDPKGIRSFIGPLASWKGIVFQNGNPSRKHN